MTTLPGRTDERVHDVAVLDEITCTGELIAAATESEGPLPLERIDECLGLLARRAS